MARITYADYAFYKGTYHGAMPESDYLRFALLAAYKLEGMTAGRVVKLYPGPPDDVAEAISMAACLIADRLKEWEENQGMAKTSETVGKHSVGYEASKRDPEARLRSDVGPFLQGIQVDGVDLLYRGADGRCRP